MSIPGVRLGLSFTGASPLRPSTLTVIGQGTVSGYCSSTAIIRLQYQTGGNAGRNGYLVMVSSVGGSTSNQVDNEQLYISISTDNGATWTNTLLKANSGFAAGNQVGLVELPSGTVLLNYEYDTNANCGGTGSSPLGTVNALQYVAKSTDGCQTWINLPSGATTPSNPITSAFSKTNQPWGQIVPKANGDLYMPWYGILGSSDTGYSIVLMKCPNGSDPTNGANWTNAVTVVANDNVNLWSEPSMVIAQDDNHLVMSLRNDHDGKGYIALSTNGGTTWGAPVAETNFKDTSGNSAAVRNTHLAKPSDGSLVCFWGTVPGIPGIQFSRSTDNGATWSAAKTLAQDARGSVNQEGYPSACIDGASTVWVSHYSYGGTGGTLGPTNAVVTKTSESWLKNPF